MTNKAIQLDATDEQLLSDLSAASRRYRLKIAAQWAVILVPTVPAVFFGFGFFGVVGLGASLAAAVAWGVTVQKAFPAKNPLETEI